MDEVLALEQEIMSALPRADEIASVADDAGFSQAVADAHDILLNTWPGPGTRLARLHSVADAIRGIV